MSLEVKAAKEGSITSRAFFPLEFMQRSQLSTGDLVKLTKNDRTLVVTAWPSLLIHDESVELSTVARLSGSFEIGELVYYEKVLDTYTEATKVQLSFISTPTFTIDQNFRLFIKQFLIEQKYITDLQILDFTYLGCNCRVKLSSITTKYACDIYLVNERTKIRVVEEANAKTSEETKPSSALAADTYDNIGGLAKQIEVIRETIETPLKNPDIYLKLGLKPPRGVLLYGPPGTGKTLIARTVAHETGAHCIVVNGPEVVSKYYGDTEQKLRDIFEDAVEHAPSVIFIDEIDALCPKRDEAPSELEKRVVTTLLTLMDGATTENNRVVVIGATNRPNSLDEALRRYGRFDVEIEIRIPDAAGRLEILKAIMKKIPNALSEEELEFLSGKLHGYVGADIAALCKEAGLNCIKRNASSTLQPSQLLVNLQDMLDAVAEIRPSAMREIMLEVPKVYWDDIGGQHDIKQRLKESVEWPLKHPEAFSRLGIRPPKGILLYGPPGCSKTLMAKALATECGSNFIAVKGPELFSKWVGESEKAVREVFRKARAASPSIVFFDEIDALTVKRGSSGDGGTSVADRVLSQLLNELDGVEPLVNVTVVAATNRPDIIDNALLRPGRIDRILYVGPPDIDSRREIFRIQLKKMAVDTDVDIEEIAKKSNGCSGAEAIAICQEAALLAMEEDVNIDSVKMRHFNKALNTFIRRITPEMLQFYKNFQEKSGLQSI
ncbi:P-loop containing nucleoside triphosphate hydrolase protein [Mycotypha africana]|uniref:P-loop containing nucleoside triphosphate hydrolase protein n=1 Tax=Mycotypha africana TaxID=64632 RepID=UPI002300347D|nr:P-loop containing nucleoside triphosphate hydrolase protein [Mycotypha africana]KAI8968217.1 P-loop containing nucleoside triphosphate hydrolase protein [Mycotypha africana]